MINIAQELSDIIKEYIIGGYKTKSIIDNYIEEVWNGDYRFKRGKFRTWYFNGKLSSESNYVYGGNLDFEIDHYKYIVKRYSSNVLVSLSNNNKYFIRNGITITWYENGKLAGIFEYKNGKKHGISRVWYTGGTIKKSVYDEGELIYEKEE